MWMDERSVHVNWQVTPVAPGLAELKALQFSEEPHLSMIRGCATVWRAELCRHFSLLRRKHMMWALLYGALDRRQWHTNSFQTNSRGLPAWTLSSAESGRLSPDTSATLGESMGGEDECHYLLMGPETPETSHHRSRIYALHTAVEDADGHTIVCDCHRILLVLVLANRSKPIQVSFA